MSRKRLIGAVLLAVVLTGCSGTDENALTTYDGSTCVYEGPLEFDLNSTVNFGFVNNSETTDMGFSVWKVPEGGTANDILGSTFEPGEGQVGFMGAINPPTVRGGTQIKTVALGGPGQYVLVCSDYSTEIDYANTVTVSEG